MEFEVAGWAFWFGRTAFVPEGKLDGFEKWLNRTADRTPCGSIFSAADYGAVVPVTVRAE
jgi:hypothetical protein